jgi:hypothetical protein
MSWFSNIYQSAKSNNNYDYDRVQLELNNVVQTQCITSMSVINKYDRNKLLKTCEKYANNNNINAIFNLAQLHYFGIGVDKDYKKSFQLYLTCSENNLTVAMNKLAMMYRNNEGTPSGEHDCKESDELLFQAAELGNHVSMKHLGDAYIYEYGLQRNIPEAIEWYKKSIANKNTSAIVCLGEIYDGTIKKKNINKHRYEILNKNKQKLEPELNKESNKNLDKELDKGLDMELDKELIMEIDTYQNYDEAFELYIKASHLGSYDGFLHAISLARLVHNKVDHEVIFWILNDKIIPDKIGNWLPTHIFKLFKHTNDSDLLLTLYKCSDYSDYAYDTLCIIYDKKIDHAIAFWDAQKHNPDIKKILQDTIDNHNKS